MDIQDKTTNTGNDKHIFRLSLLCARCGNKRYLADLWGGQSENRITMRWLLEYPDCPACFTPYIPDGMLFLQEVL